MKKMPVFVRMLLPALAALILLPVLSWFVFQSAATRQAYQRAEADLTALERRISGLVEQYLVGPFPRGEQPIRLFLRVAKAAARSAYGDARLLLYSGARLIYPNDEDELSGIEELDRAVTTMLKEGAAEKGSLRVSAGGELYLAHVSEAPVESNRLRYIVTCCPVSRIGDWVADAAKIVLLATTGLVALLVLATALTARSVTRPMETLCRAAERFGRKDFSQEETTFSLRELEALRLGMNSMADSLRKADEAERRFFQNVSHELRTPLMSISGYAQGIEQGVLPDARSAAGIILSESARLTEMVNEILTLSRIETDMEPAALSPVSLSVLCDETADRIAGLALRAGVRIENVAADSPLWVEGNGEALCRALGNLLSNAIRHARSCVALIAYEENGMAVVSVADDGSGIAEEDLPRLFERCYKGKGGHLGLGLAIAEAEVKRCGGTISVGNRPEGGAEFRIFLKLLRKVPENVPDWADADTNSEE